VTDAQLIADIAAGYDAVLMGADKWAQVIDPAWYASTLARDEAVARLPRVLVAARPPFSASDVELLELPPSLLAVSSTAARQGHREFMSEEAASFDQETGAWSDPDRYARFVAEPPGTLER
jgi:hypothetical protein